MTKLVKLESGQFSFALDQLTLSFKNTAPNQFSMVVATSLPQPSQILKALLPDFSMPELAWAAQASLEVTTNDELEIQSWSFQIQNTTPGGSILPALPSPPSLEGYPQNLIRFVEETKVETLGLRLEHGEVWFSAVSSLAEWKGKGKLGFDRKAQFIGIGFEGDQSQSMTFAQLLATLHVPEVTNLPLPNVELKALQFSPNDCFVKVAISNRLASVYKCDGSLGIRWQEDSAPSFMIHLEATKEELVHDSDGKLIERIIKPHQAPSIAALLDDFGLTQYLEILPKPIAQMQVYRLLGKLDSPAGELLLGGSAYLFDAEVSLDIELSWLNEKRLRFDLAIANGTPASLPEILQQMELGIATDHPLWQYLPQTELKASLSQLAFEIEDEDPNFWFSVGTQVQIEDSVTNLQLSGQLSSEGTAFNFIFASVENPMSMTDALRQILDENARQALNSFVSESQGQQNFLAKLMNTALIYFELDLFLSSKNALPQFNVQATFDLLEQPMGFELGFKSNPEGQPAIYISIGSEEDQGFSVPDLINELALDLGEIQSFLPTSRLNLQELTLDTGEGSFYMTTRVSNGFTPDDSFPAYAVLAGISLLKNNTGFDFEISLDATEKPLSLRSLSKDLKLHAMTHLCTQLGTDLLLHHAGIKAETEPTNLSFYLSASLSFDLLFQRMLQLESRSPELSKELKLETLELDILSANNLIFKSELKSNLKLSDFVKMLSGADYPHILPDVAVPHLGIEYNSLSGAFTFETSAKASWQIDAQEFAIAIQFAFSRNDSNELSCKLNIATENQLHICDGLALDAFQFAFEYADSQWRLDSALTANVFYEPMSLAVSYQHGSKLSLKSSRAAVTPLLDLGVANLNYREFELQIERKTEAEKTFNSWKLQTTGSLAIIGLLDIEGSLSLSSDKNQFALRFQPQTATLQLPAYAAAPWVDLQYHGLEVGHKDGQWSLVSDASFGLPAFHNALPHWLKAVVPEQLSGTLQISHQGVILSCERLSNPVSIPIPPLEALPQINLGSIGLDLNNLNISLGQEITASASLVLDLPESINYIFGLDTTHNPAKPSYELFETRFQFALKASAQGISFVPQTALFKGITSREESGVSWWDLDLGQFGAVSLRVPEFKYNAQTGALVAKGGFRTLRPLSVPLKPLQQLLDKLALGELGQMLPEKFTLDDSLSLLNEEKRLDVDKIGKLFETILPGPTPGTLAEAIRVLDRYLGKLPKAFRNYLELDIPESFLFDISIGVEGSLRIDLRVGEGDKPIRAMFPTLRGPILAMQGIEFHSLSLGALAGGNLLLLQADMRLDEFDILTLAASLLIPDDEHIPLPGPNDIQRRLIIDKLFMLIIPHTGVPIPLPLFYDQLGFEVCGIEGVRAEAHLGFPMPTLDLAAAGRTLTGLKAFITDPNATFPDNGLGGMSPRLEIGRNYIQLPEYLGGESLGYQGEPIVLRADTLAAKLANALKFNQINELIALAPLNYRMGTAGVSLGPLQCNTTWLLATPPELEKAAIEHLGLSQFDIEAVLGAMPQADEHTQGVITLLKGAWGIGNSRLEARFGLALTGMDSFRTGMTLSGNLGNLIEFDMKGRVLVNAPSPNGTHQPPRFAGGSRSFNGDQDSLVIPHHPAYFMEKVTIELWFRPERGGLDTHEFLISRGDGDLVIHLRAHPNDRLNLRFFPTTSLGFDTPEFTLMLGVWTHLACVYDPANKEGKVYINGQDTGAITINPHNLGNPLQQNPKAILLGTHHAPGHPWPYKGALAEVRLWNRILTQTEIHQRINQRLQGDEPGLVGYWPLDDRDQSQESRLRDRSPNANHAVVHGTTANFKKPPKLPVSPDLVQAFQFTGNGYMQVPPHSDHQITRLCIELWFNSIGGGTQYICTRSEQNFEIWISETGSLHFAPTPGVQITTQQPIQRGQWTHLACNYDPTAGIANICLNGSAQRVQAHGPLSQPLRSEPTLPLLVGRNQTGTSFFNGQIAELRLWSRTRSAQNIADEMRLSLHGREQGLIGYWPMNETEGNTAYDRTSRQYANLEAINHSPMFRIMESGAVSLETSLMARSASDSENSFSLLGAANLKVMGHPFFDAQIEVSDQGFELEGMLSLFPSHFPFQVNGYAFGRLNDGGLTLAGSVTATLGQVTLAQTNAFVRYSREKEALEMFLRTSLMGQRLELALNRNPQYLAARTQLKLELDLAAPLRRLAERLKIGTIPPVVTSLEVRRLEIRIDQTSPQPIDQERQKQIQQKIRETQQLIQEVIKNSRRDYNHLEEQINFLDRRVRELRADLQHQENPRWRTRFETLLSKVDQARAAFDQTKPTRDQAALWLARSEAILQNRKVDLNGAIAQKRIPPELRLRLRRNAASWKAKRTGSAHWKAELANIKRTLDGFRYPSVSHTTTWTKRLENAVWYDYWPKLVRKNQWYRDDQIRWVNELQHACDQIINSAQHQINEATAEVHNRQNILRNALTNAAQYVAEAHAGLTAIELERKLELEKDALNVLIASDQCIDHSETMALDIAGGAYTTRVYCDIRFKLPGIPQEFQLADIHWATTQSGTFDPNQIPSLIAKFIGENLDVVLWQNFTNIAQVIRYLYQLIGHRPRTEAEISTAISEVSMLAGYAEIQTNEAERVFNLASSS